MRKLRFYFGILFILVGTIFLVGSFSGITGFAIIEDYLSRPAFSLIGVVFFLVGVILTTSGIIEQEKRASSLEELVRNRVKNPKGVLLLLDADFMRNMQDETYAPSHQAAQISQSYFGSLQPAISPQVYDEMTRTTSNYPKPLITQPFMNYMDEKYHVLHLGREATSKERETIYNIWKTQTKQGIEATKEDEAKFLNSGDIEMLAIALKRGKDPTVILTDNFTEFKPITEILRLTHRVKVYAINGKQIKRASASN